MGLHCRVNGNVHFGNYTEIDKDHLMLIMMAMRHHCVASVEFSATISQIDIFLTDTNDVGLR